MRSVKRTLAIADPDAVMALVARIRNIQAPDVILACARATLSERTTQPEMDLILASRIVSKDWRDSPCIG